MRFRNRCGLRKPPRTETAWLRSRIAAAAARRFAALRDRHRRPGQHFDLANGSTLGALARPSAEQPTPLSLKRMHRHVIFFSAFVGYRTLVKRRCWRWEA